MYFQNFGSFNKAVDDATRFQFQVVLVSGGSITSSTFPKEGYAAAIEALATFHEQKTPFLLWSNIAISAIPYEQIQQIKLMFAEKG